MVKFRAPKFYIDDEVCLPDGKVVKVLKVRYLSGGFWYECSDGAFYGEEELRKTLER